MNDMLASVPTGVLILCALFGYLSGSIPFGLVLTRAFGLGDLRSIGSGNIGATNALRTGNKLLAGLTFLGDVLKGTIPVLVAWRWGIGAAGIAGIAAFLGHLFPIWLRFRGGKGVATYLGVLLGLAPIGVPVFAVVWLGMAFLFRYSSLAALAATLVVPIVLYLIGNTPAAALTALLTLLVYIKHHANIRRLTSGTETKIGSKG
ncbi:glycerol-3-phosphate 1-O-acyltransferase PlsY [Aureimonas frigidaquae]|uniref:Glycerol-3-phosphate acyltransferase n=1 Tax=Aureimonas frigidaquae TaxID=424757 RepID=A0A0P0Z446_9HYPH|nr:glycerol-3-phosphate 1-O-acyltransferase PlsY [Aureimonas frigidaquae]BAT28909.1 glycerol-3-phosphate acyltransferase PlsY [Aureimonas frigidaquae]